MVRNTALADDVICQIRNSFQKTRKDLFLQGGGNNTPTNLFTLRQGFTTLLLAVFNNIRFDTRQLITPHRTVRLFLTVDIYHPDHSEATTPVGKA